MPGRGCAIRMRDTPKGCRHSIGFRGWGCGRAARWRVRSPDTRNSPFRAVQAGQRGLFCVSGRPVGGGACWLVEPASAQQKTEPPTGTVRFFVANSGRAALLDEVDQGVLHLHALVSDEEREILAHGVRLPCPYSPRHASSSIVLPNTSQTWHTPSSPMSRPP